MHCDFGLALDFGLILMVLFVLFGGAAQELYTHVANAAQLRRGVCAVLSYGQLGGSLPRQHCTAGPVLWLRNHWAVSGSQVQAGASRTMRGDSLLVALQPADAGNRMC